MEAVKQQILQNSPVEMDKAIVKFHAMGKPVNPDSLLEDARNTPDFFAVCEKLGIPYSWFEQLAKDRIIEADKHNQSVPVEQSGSLVSAGIGNDSGSSPASQPTSIFGKALRLIGIKQ